MGVQRGHPVTFLPKPRHYVSLGAALDNHRVIKFRDWIAKMMEGTRRGAFALFPGKKRKRPKKTRCPYHDVAYETLEQTCLEMVCLRL